MNTKNKRRVRPFLLGLLWIWAILMFVVVDLFRDVPAFDRVRPEWSAYEQARLGAHAISGERYRGKEIVAVRVRPAVVRLRDALTDVDHADSRATLEELARHADDPRARIKAIRRLAQEHRARDLLLTIAADEGDSEKVRAQAARYLGRTGPDALTGLDRLARTAPPRVRKGVYLGYAELGTREAARALVEHEADGALARIANPDAIPVLADAARTRAAACTALGNTKSADAVAPLSAVLADLSIHPRIRAAAAEAIGRLGRREALGVVTAAGKDPHRDVVLAAERARQRLWRR